MKEPSEQDSSGRREGSNDKAVEIIDSRKVETANEDRHYHLIKNELFQHTQTLTEYRSENL